MGDIGGAAGTIFFQFVLGQLIYAEQYNLVPWIHFNNVSYIVYDPLIHGQGPGVSLSGMGGRQPVRLSILEQGGHWRDQYPGPLDETIPTSLTDYHFAGTGVWEHYFEPVSDFVPGDTSCAKKLYVTLDLFLITPGIHGFAPWAPRCWRYHYLPEYITHPHEPLQDWLAPSRLQGHTALSKYIRFKPYLLDAAQRVNPKCSLASPCLGLHIRHSDKAAGRRVIETAEFLPFVQAFLYAGGQHIYLATDSTQVLSDVQNWPLDVRRRIRTMNNIVRSVNTTAVFDMASHHVTNQEVLTEILALSQCQFMVNGLSAVSESAIWINYDLHHRSVNLEDPDHPSPAVFATIIQMALRQSNEMASTAAAGVATTTTDVADVVPPRSVLPRPVAWYDEGVMPRTFIVSHTACESANGVLHIATSGRSSSLSGAFFVSVVNQIIFAQQHNLLPWVHLSSGTSPHIYDPAVHDNNATSVEMMFGMGINWFKEEGKPDAPLPGEPVLRSDKLHLRNFDMQGNGIWETYLEPVSDFQPGDLSCRVKPLVPMDENMLTFGINPHWDKAVRPWRYDNVLDEVWNPQKLPLKDFLAPMRVKGHEIVSKHFRFHSYLTDRAKEVNPWKKGETCLAIHLRNGDKNGKYRTKIKVPDFLDYVKSYAEAGGKTIYVASDSDRALQYLEKNFPADIVQHVRSQGKDVVRTSKGYPTHSIGRHHRVNSETIVDILAMSRCRFLLHTYSSTSEAAIYINPVLHKNSVNLEDAGRMSPAAFGDLVRSELELLPVVAQPAEPTELSENEVAQQVPQSPSSIPSLGPVVRDIQLNTTILYRHSDRKCQRNAIVYLAQKNHSSYKRDSYATLFRSLSLLNQNYLSINKHMDSVDLFIFHTGDFVKHDLKAIERLLGPSSIGAIRLVNLVNSTYWARPATIERDNPQNWHAYPLFSEGYRKMMSWFAIEMWDYFKDLNEATGCRYKYIMRLDEDSFIHSPIEYDVFDYMKANDHVYGYRMCSYEMKKARFFWKAWAKRHEDFAPHRQIAHQSCGFYNNFFVADLGFFASASVRSFLHTMQRQGAIYRRRLGDLLIHTMVVYAFATSRRIHRFLDFTYEHGTVNEGTGCLAWGGIQAGYKDEHAMETLERYYQDMLIARNCTANATFLDHANLSPTYSHVPAGLQKSLSLWTITAGEVELPGMGLYSG
jgi:Glycolipid 2-alpha-mannosyltransferase